MNKSTDVNFCFEKTDMSIKAQCCATFETRIDSCRVVRLFANGFNAKVNFYTNRQDIVYIDMPHIDSYLHCLDLVKRTGEAFCVQCPYNAMNQKVK